MPRRPFCWFSQEYHLVDVTPPWTFRGSGGGGCCLFYLGWDRWDPVLSWLRQFAPDKQLGHGTGPHPYPTLGPQQIPYPRCLPAYLPTIIPCEQAGACCRVCVPIIAFTCSSQHLPRCALALPQFPMFCLPWTRQAEEQAGRQGGRNWRAGAPTGLETA